MPETREGPRRRGDYSYSECSYDIIYYYANRCTIYHYGYTYGYAYC